MPAVDKLLLEEALQDSPQVPPAAPAPLAGELRPRKPRQPLGGGGEGAGPALRPPPGMIREWAPLWPSWRPRGSPLRSLLCHDLFPNSTEAEAAGLNFGSSTY